MDVSVMEVVALIGSTLSLLGVFYFATTRLAKLEVKVDTMWTFLMRRAVSEAVVTGKGEILSPVVINAAAKKLLEPLSKPLQELYAKCPKRITDNDLALKIEEKFGDQILKDVCIPNSLFLGACLIIAVQVAKDAASIEIAPTT